MQSRKETVRGYISDMLALNKHVDEALKRQVNDKSIKHVPSAFEVVRYAERMISMNIEELTVHLETFDKSAMESVKEMASTAAGVAAGWIGNARSNTASRMLRDDYTALSLAAISYTMLHTTSLALNDEVTADLATRQLKRITPIITQISKVISYAVALELTEDAGNAVDTTVAATSTEATQEAWDADVVNNFPSAMMA